ETVKTLQEKIRALKEERDSVSSNAEKYKEYTARIDAVQKKIEAITGKASAKNFAKELKERDKALQDFFESLNKAEDEARRSGLTREQSELDKINSRYDELLAKSKELGLGAGVDRRIENARKAQTGNFQIRQDVQDYRE